MMRLCLKEINKKELLNVKSIDDIKAGQKMIIPIPIPE